MKILIPILTIAVWSAGTSLRGEPASNTSSSLTQLLQESTEQSGQAAIEAEKAQKQIQRMEADVQKQMSDAQRQIQGMNSQLSGVAAAIQLAQAGAEGEDAAVVYDQMRAYTERLAPTIRRVPTGSTKGLVIRSADTDAAVQANLEEDLAVMSRIFDKTVDEVNGGKGARSPVMGINVMFSPGPNLIRSLYLDGYGALFMLKVNIPLIAPPKPTEEPKEKPVTDSSWEDAKRELYGQSGDRKTVAIGDEYDADKVAKLKDGLLEALKSATNIRNLKADDSVTVCVFGGAPIMRVQTITTGGRVANPFVASRGGSPENNKTVKTVISDNSGPTRGSTLTLRVKKSDIDAFAKGKLNLEDFRKKANLTIYANNFDSGPFGGGFDDSIKRYESYGNTFR